MLLLILNNLFTNTIVFKIIKRDDSLDYYWDIYYLTIKYYLISFILFFFWNT